MHDHLLADIGKSILTAGLIGLPAYYLGIPLILAYLIAGVVLGSEIGFGFIQEARSISNISEIGLVLLLFILGLEINIKKLLKTGKTVLIVGTAQIIGCVILGYLFFSLFARPQAATSYETLYLALACALSSTLIVVKILSDQMELDSLTSRISLGVLIIQDLFAIGFLALQPNLNNLNALSLGFSFSKVAVLVLFCAFLARYILPFIFKKSGQQPELMLIMAMAWCFGVCGVANYLGLSIEMGALVAGISIASFPYHLDVAAKITSLRDFFITLFFVSLGLKIPMPDTQILTITALICFFTLSSRILTITPVMHKLRYGNRASLIPALNLSQLSEFSLVLATLGVSYNHIPQDLLSAFILALVITALISSFVLPHSHTVYKKMNPLLEKIGFHDHVSGQNPSSESDEKNKKTHPPLVILGFYRDASSLIYDLQTKYSEEYLKQFLVVDFNPEVHQKLQERGLNCIYGDIGNSDTLRSLNLSHAKVIICSIPDKILKGTSNMKLLKSLKQLAPQSQIIVTAEELEKARELYAEGAAYVYIPRIISSTYLLDIIERMQISGPQNLKADAEKFILDRKEVIS